MTPHFPTQQLPYSYLTAQHEVDQLGEGVAQRRHHLHHLAGRVAVQVVVVVVTNLHQTLTDLSDHFTLTTQR